MGFLNLNCPDTLRPMSVAITNSFFFLVHYALSGVTLHFATHLDTQITLIDVFYIFVNN
jgi:hypothetical protein